MSIEHADFDGIERLALVLGGEIASTFDRPEEVKLGQCKSIEEIMIGQDKLIHFSGDAIVKQYVSSTCTCSTVGGTGLPLPSLPVA